MKNTLVFACLLFCAMVLLSCNPKQAGTDAGVISVGTENILQDSEIQQLPTGPAIEVADYSSYISPVSASGELAGNHGIWEIFDDFSSYNSETWLAFTDKNSTSSADNIRLEEGLLHLSPQADRGNPFLFSKPVPLPESGMVRVRRQLTIHPGGGKFLSYLGIIQTLQEPVPLHRITNPYNDTIPLSLVYYLDFSTPPGFLPLQKGIIISNGNTESEENFLTIEGQFNNLIDEELIYDPRTGTSYHRMGSVRTIVRGESPQWPYFTIAMANLGESTEGRVEIEWLHLDFTDKRAIEPWFTTEASSAPLPGQAGTPWEVSIVPDFQTTTLHETPVLDISLPPMAGETIPLSVIPLVPDAVPFGQWRAAADISLGGETIFHEPIAIRFNDAPEPTVPAPGEFGIYPFSGVSWDPETKTWLPEALRIRNGRFELLTRHLSTFAMLEDGPWPTAVYNPGENIPTEAEAKEAYWSALKSSVGNTGELGTISTFVSDFPFLEELDGAVGVLANTTMVLGIVKDIQEGKGDKAKMDILKAASSWPLGALGTMGAKIAGLGVFFLDKSLQSFAEGVKEARDESLTNAYLAYYRRLNWTASTWLEKISELLRRPGNEEDHRQDLLQLVQSYPDLIWEDEGGFEENLPDHRQGAWTGDAGLTEALKEEMAAELMEVTWPTIQVAMERAFDVLETEAIRQRVALEFKTREMLEGHVQYWVTAYGKHQVQQVEAVFTREGKPVFRGQPVQVRGDFSLSLPVKRLQKEAPDQVILYVREKEGDPLKEYAKERISYSGSINGSIKVIDISFDIKTEVVTAEEEQEEPEEEKPQPPESSSRAELIQTMKSLETSRDPEQAAALIEKLRPYMKKETSNAAVRWLLSDEEEWSYLELKDSGLASEGFLYLKFAPSNDPLSNHGGGENYRFIGLPRPADLPKNSANAGFTPEFHGPVYMNFPNSTQPEKEEFYLFGLLWGEYRDYYSNGQVKSKGRYTAGKKSGPWEYYEADGSLEAAGSYNEEGKKEGEWIETKSYYGAKAHRQFRMEYTNGKVTNDSDLQAVMKEMQEQNSRQYD